MYTLEEKEAWSLGSLVENVSLVADRDRLLAYVRRENRVPPSTRGRREKSS